MAYHDLVDEIDRERLERLQTLRETIITELTKEGLPDDKNDRLTLLEAMKDMDRSIYGKARIKVSDKTADQLKDVSKVIAEVLTRHATITSTPRTSSTELTTQYELKDLVEGETSLNANDLDYKDFMP